MGYGKIFQENNGIVKKYSDPEELLNDRFIPMRKASSLTMNCENPETENNENKEEGEEQSLSISSIYKKHVLSLNNGQN
jgi:hypothetical protein